MKHLARAAAAAAAFVGVAAAQAAADPADPTPPVLAPAYRSVFQDLPTGVEEEQLDWKKANADVALFPRGHADYLKWEERQAGQGAAGGDAATTKPAAPAATPAPAPGPRGHERHH